MQKKWNDAFSDEGTSTATDSLSSYSDNYADDDGSGSDRNTIDEEVSIGAFLSKTRLSGDAFSECSETEHYTTEELTASMSSGRTLEDWEKDEASLAYSYTTEDDWARMEDTIAALEKKVRKYKKKSKELSRKLKSRTNESRENKQRLVDLRHDYALLNLKLSEAKTHAESKSALATAILASRRNDDEVKALNDTITSLNESLRRTDYVFATMCKSRSQD